MSFKVGDKVKVKENLRVGKFYDGVYFSTEMDKFKGKVVEIMNIYDNYYGIKVDDWNFYFSDEMLEPIKFKKSDLRDGNKITLRNGKVGVYTGDETYIDGLCNCHINNDLTNNGSRGSELDIVKVERPRTYKTVYEREKVREMTVEEICKALGYEVKVVEDHE